MGMIKDALMISYVKDGDPNGKRYRQSAYDAVPIWATDIKEEWPTDEEIKSFLSGERLKKPEK